MVESSIKRSILHQHIRPEIRLNVYQVVSAFTETDMGAELALKELSKAYQASDNAMLKDFSASLLLLHKSLENGEKLGTAFSNHLSVGMGIEEKILLVALDKTIDLGNKDAIIRVLNRIIDVIRTSV